MKSDQNNVNNNGIGFNENNNNVSGNSFEENKANNLPSLDDNDLDKGSSSSQDDNVNSDEEITNDNHNNSNISTNNFSQDSGEPDKKAKAEQAGKDISEMAARGLATYYGGQTGAAIADAIIKTKIGQKALALSGKMAASAPMAKGELARKQELIHEAKPYINKYIGEKTAAKNGINTGTDDGEHPKLLDDSEKSNISDYPSDDYGFSNDYNSGGKTDSSTTNISSISTILLLLLFSIIFLISIVISVFVVLGIIDVDNSASLSINTNSNSSYTLISSNTSCWWPIGSRTTQSINGVTYANGDPSSTLITATFAGDDTTHNGNHGAIDISAVINTENVIATMDGTVIYPTMNDNVSIGTCDYYGTKSNCNGYGNYVMINHGNGLISLYGHMHANTITVRAGDQVKQGQVLGKSGSSGNSTGGHLHFEMRLNGTKVDPLNYVFADNPRPISKNFNGSTNEVVE